MKLRKRVSHTNSHSDDLLEAERDYKRLRSKYGKLFDRKKEIFLTRLEQRAIQSLNAKDLMTFPKRVAGERYLKIPVIIPGDGTQPGPLNSSESQ